MTVETLFAGERLTRETVSDAQDKSDYWSKASAFVLQNWEVEIDRLTPAQLKWLYRIHEDMTEMRIEGKL